MKEDNLGPKNIKLDYKFKGDNDLCGTGVSFKI